jgi:hypothetical protein
MENFISLSNIKKLTTMKSFGNAMALLIHK